MTLASVTAFFGWITLINLAFLMFSALAMWAFRDMGQRMHAAMFKIPQEQLPIIWYTYLGNFKLFILAFNLSPYLALRIIM